MISRFTYGFVLLAISFHVSTFAFDLPVNQQQADSLLEVTTNHIYENPDKSIELGLNIYNNTNFSRKSRARSLMLVSLAYTSKRDYQKALEYVVKADEFTKDLNDKVLQIEILFRTGILYQQLKIFDKSIEYLEKTEQQALLYPVRDSVGKLLANSYTVKGFIYKDNLNCDIALEYFNKGIKEYQRLKNTDVNTNLSIVHYNKGNCYTLLSEYNEAIKSFNKSIAFAQIENANSLIAFAQKGLAEVYTLQGEYRQALNLLHTALNKSNNVGDLVLNLGIYNGLFENYLALNQWDEYQKYYDLYAKTQLGIKLSERNSISASLEETSKIQNQNLNALKRRFNSRLNWIFGAIIFIIFGVLLVERKNLKVMKSLRNKLKTIQNKK
ncbi:tetratricopeptide repeat protein [Winogradskyella pulchriflava]|uniref:Tetratricopeptide repeat protein n=1 Tax=Winogradskyella pulchriflava TaxID=1110688 RepID=A0ABV6QB16_9FLAO